MDVKNAQIHPAICGKGVFYEKNCISRTCSGNGTHLPCRVLLVQQQGEEEENKQQQEEELMEF